MDVSSTPPPHTVPLEPAPRQYAAPKTETSASPRPAYAGGIGGTAWVDKSNLSVGPSSSSTLPGPGSRPAPSATDHITGDGFQRLSLSTTFLPRSPAPILQPSPSPPDVEDMSPRTKRKVPQALKLSRRPGNYTSILPRVRPRRQLKAARVVWGNSSTVLPSTRGDVQHQKRSPRNTNPEPASPAQGSGSAHFRGDAPSRSKAERDHNNWLLAQGHWLSDYLHSDQNTSATQGLQAPVPATPGCLKTSHISTSQV